MLSFILTFFQHQILKVGNLSCSRLNALAQFMLKLWQLVLDKRLSSTILRSHAFVLEEGVWTELKTSC